MRFISPSRPRRSHGPVADVYRQIRRHFGLLADLDGNSPFLAHSPQPELLEGVWSVLYETVLVEGSLDRADKEAIGAAVSRLNDCPFCTESHALLAGVVGVSGDRQALLDGHVKGIEDERRRRLVEWAAETRSPHSEVVLRPPFSTLEAPEAIGTAVSFHYVNRVVEVLQGHGTPSIGPKPLEGLARLGLKIVVKRTLRSECRAGMTLDLLPEAELPTELSWARTSPRLAGAFARFAAAIDRAGTAVLSEDERTCIHSAVSGWSGADPPLGTEWLEPVLSRLEPDSIPAGRLGVLSALAPHRVDERVVREFRKSHPGDPDLVGVIAWSSFTAARRIGEWLQANVDAGPDRRTESPP